MEVIAVIGTGGAGKSHHCGVLARVYEPHPIIVRPGKWFREMFGPSFFAKCERPSAPLITEDLVRSIIREAICIGVSYSRNVLLDGVPRHKDQLNFLLDLCWKMGVDVIELRLVYTDELAQQERLRQRHQQEGDKELAQARLESDARLTAEVIGEFQKRQRCHPKLYRYVEINNDRITSEICEQGGGEKGSSAAFPAG